MAVPPPVRPGDVLAQKYRVERTLGAGGMGVVVAARHLHLDQLVALKFVHPDALQDQDVVARFQREARAAVRLKSEHVARILDVGVLENGAPYIVMEYLQGQDLAGLLGGWGKVQVPVAVDFVLQACDAIAEAHELGIVHRDLKPANLFLTDSAHGTKVVKVLDFGISKSSVAGDPSMTRTAAIMGSPAYMSPEQMRSARSVDGRTDIWSLGVILWELIVGRVPFIAESFTELCIRIAMDPLPPLPYTEGMPPGLEAVLVRCLAKDPAVRYATVAELAGALAPFTYPAAREIANRLQARQIGIHGALSVPGRLFVPGSGPQIATVETTIDRANGETTRSRTMTRKPRSRAALLGGFAVAIVTLVAVVAIVAGGSHDTPTTPTTPAAQPDPSATKTTNVPASPPAAEGAAAKPIAPVVTPLAPAAQPDAAVEAKAPAVEPGGDRPDVVNTGVDKDKDKDKDKTRTKSKSNTGNDTKKGRGKPDFDPYSSPD